MEYKSWTPPTPDDVRTYVIGSAPPQVQITIRGVPPCLWCGAPVTELSTAGPLVCLRCDAGENRDGTTWTPEQFRARREHYQRVLEAYRSWPGGVYVPPENR